MVKKQIKCKIALALATLMLSTVMLSGCGSKSPTTGSDTGTNASGLKPVTLKWYVPATTTDYTEDGLKATLAEVNKKLQKEINVTLDLSPINWADYDQKMPIIIASGEKYDMCFTSYWINDFVSNVGKGAFAKLDDPYKKYGTTMQKLFPPAIVDCLKVNGGLYALPTYAIYASPKGPYIRKDLADKYNFHPDYNGVTSISDLEAFFDKVLAGEKGIIPTYVTKDGFWSYFQYYEGALKVATDVTAVKPGDSSLKVFNMYESQGFKDYATMMKRWHDKGYIRKDIATYTLNNDNISNDLKAGKYATFWTGAIAPDVDITARNAVDNKYDMLGAPITSTYYDSNAGAVHAVAVSSGSKNADRAVMLLDLLNKDSTLFNTLLWGVPGKNYTKVSDNAIEPIKNTGYGNGVISPLTDFTIGNQLEGWLTKETLDKDPKLAEEDAAWGKSAKPSGLEGFNFDPKNVKTEIANCDAIIKEYEFPFDCGIGDVDVKLPEFISKLKAAGSDTIVKEMQTQIDSWRKTTGK